jgi:hypothetical protein
MERIHQTSYTAVIEVPFGRKDHATTGIDTLGIREDEEQIWTNSSTCTITINSSIVRACIVAVDERALRLGISSFIDDTSMALMTLSEFGD